MDIGYLVNQLLESTNDDAYKASDKLAAIGTEEVFLQLIELLSHSENEVKLLAARTLSLFKNNQAALDPLFDTIDASPTIAGDLLVYLYEFDISDKFVPIFKLSLFGGFKASSIAQNLLDYEEFNISTRVLKKAEKAWNHYVNNIKHDELFELKKREVEEMFDELNELLKE